MLLGLTTFVTTRSRTPQNDCNTSSSAEGPGPGCGTRGRRQGLAKQQANAPSNISDLAPLVWRAPEGSAAVPVDGGRAWPGFEATRRAKGSRRGRLAGGPPPTGTHSGRALRRPKHPWGHTATQPHSGRALRRPEHQQRPEHQRRHTPPRHNKTARPHRGRAAQSVSEAHRRTTTMSGSPRPLSWRTLEIPSLAATSFAVPSMRGSS